jgi:hypothetical protein
MGETGTGDRTDVFQPGNRPMGSPQPTPAQGLAARKKARAKMGETDTELAFFGGRARGIAGDYDGVKPKATSAQKTQFTNAAKMVFERSKPGVLNLVMTSNLRAEINALTQALDSLQPWTATWLWDSFNDSQTVRSNLGQALKNVKIVEGSTGGDWTPETKAMEKVSTTGTFASNVASKGFVDDVKRTASGLVPTGLGIGGTMLLLGAGYLVWKSGSLGAGRRYNPPFRGGRRARRRRARGGR